MLSFLIYYYNDYISLSNKYIYKGIDRLKLKNAVWRMYEQYFEFSN